MSSGKKDTYCPLLWGEVFIDPQGDVYSCCHRRPSVIGNIHHEKLQDIYNNGTIRRLRQKSLEGQLECFEHCTIIDKEKERKSLRKTAFDYFTDLKRLKIEFGELCNINCVMCWQDHRNKTVLAHKALIKNVDFTPFESIDIQGGEPLAIPEAKAFYDYITSRNKDPLLMTNALLLSDEWVEKIVLNSSCIYISLNAATARTHEKVNRGSKWNVVLKNIKKLEKAREQHRVNFKIIGHMTIITENIHEIALFIANFRKLGVDQIDFGYDGRVPGYLRDHAFLKIALKRDIYKAYRMSRDSSSVDLKRLKMLELI